MHYLDADISSFIIQEFIMGFPDGQAAYEQKKLELHAKLDQTKKVSLATVSLVRSRLARRLSHPSPTKIPRPYMPSTRGKCMTRQ